MEISNKLLSWVFGCECEFDQISTHTCTLFFNGEREKVELRKDNNYKIFFEKWPENKLPSLKFANYRINLHTFIHMAKVKAFEAGYIVIEYPLGVQIKYTPEAKKMIRGQLFGHAQMIKALEWICNEIEGGESEQKKTP